MRNSKYDFKIYTNGVFTSLFLVSVVYNSKIETNGPTLSEISKNISVVKHFLRDLLMKYAALKNISKVNEKEASHLTKTKLNEYFKENTDFQSKEEVMTKDPQKFEPILFFTDQSIEDSGNDVNEKEIDIKKFSLTKKQRKYVVKKHFQGFPKRDDFEIVETELPPIKNGEILLKTEWISVDTYQLTQNLLYPVPYDQFGYQVSVVLASKDPRYPEGTRIVSYKGWCDHTIINTSTAPSGLNVVYKLPDLKGLPNSLGIGAIGIPGAKAYFGFLEICQPKTGETVVVTGAAGSVGSIVGQIAKIKGCRVIGLVGSDDRVEWLEKELGFDKALNIRSFDVIEALKDAAPKGIDCFFDNVGGEMSSQIISQMNLYGRVAVCESSYYNKDQRKIPKASMLQPSIVSKELKIEGFIVSRWLSRWPEAFADLVKWMKSGQLKTREQVTEGFDKVYDAFVEMLSFRNIGKAVVKV